MSAEDTIQEFAPALRTNGRIEAFRVSLQLLGDLTGFGISYFDISYFDMDDSRGYVKTATEVSSDNSALMRNIRRHENSLEGSIVSIARDVMFASRSFGEGEVHMQFDDSIIQDTAAEKEQDMREVGVTMGAWEYRMRWYGEEEAVARARAAEVGTGAVWDALTVSVGWDGMQPTVTDASGQIAVPPALDDGPGVRAAGVGADDAPRDRASGQDRRHR